MPPHDERSRPDGNRGGSSEAIGSHFSTSVITLSGKMIFAEIDARQLGRFLELDPSLRSQIEARRAFILASTIREVRGAVCS